MASTTEQPQHADERRDAASRPDDRSIRMRLLRYTTGSDSGRERADA